MGAIEETDPTYLCVAAQQRFFELMRVAYWPEHGAELDAELERARREGLACASDGREPARDELDELVRASLDRARVVLDELAAEPFRAYRRGWDRRKEARERWLDDQDGLSRPLPRGLRLSFAIGEGSLGNIGPPGRWEELKGAGGEWAPLREVLQTWATRWRLGADWCLDSALSTLALWCATAGTADMRLITNPARLSQIPMIRYEIRWWDPSSAEDFDAFKRRARGELIAQFEEDVDETERWARENRWPLRKAAFADQTFAWLIRYQVLGDSLYQIAQEFDRDDGQVRRAVRRLAEYLQLPLRPAAAGRPRGSRTRRQLHP